MDYSNIILEMLNRIQTLEKEVAQLKQNLISEKKETQLKKPQSGVASPMVFPSAPIVHPAAKRDTTRYMFEGNVYLKNRLVLAVVHAYVRDHPDISRSELKSVFSKSLQGSLGVVEFAEIAELRGDCNVRFFAKEDEVVHLCDGDVYVCSQWGILNIPNFIKYATQLNYKIEAI